MDSTPAKNKDTALPQAASVYKIVSVLKTWMKAPKSIKLEEGKFLSGNVNLFLKKFGNVPANIITKSMELMKKMVKDLNMKF